METEEHETSADKGIREEFGKKIREARNRKGLTQDTLAALLRAQGLPLSQTMVAKIERGARPTPAEEIPVIAAALGVNIADLFPSEGPVVQDSRLRQALHETGKAGDAIGRAVLDYMFRKAVLKAELDEAEEQARAHAEELSQREARSLEKLLDEARAQVAQTYEEAIAQFMTSTEGHPDIESSEAWEAYSSRFTEDRRGIHPEAP